MGVLTPQNDEIEGFLPGNYPSKGCHMEAKMARKRPKSLFFGFLGYHYSCLKNTFCKNVKNAKNVKKAIFVKNALLLKVVASKGQ